MYYFFQVISSESLNQEALLQQYFLDTKFLQKKKIILKILTKFHIFLTVPGFRGEIHLLNVSHRVVELKKLVMRSGNNFGLLLGKILFSLARYEILFVSINFYNFNAIKNLWNEKFSPSSEHFEYRSIEEKLRQFLERIEMSIFKSNAGKVNKLMFYLLLQT